jgi:hypothetical protein
VASGKVTSIRKLGLPSSTLKFGFLMDAQPETIKGDDYLLKYDSDGYPELPACLYRREPRLREAA